MKAVESSTLFQHSCVFVVAHFASFALWTTAPAQCPQGDAFSAPIALGVSGWQVTSADFNDDGVLDLAFGYLVRSADFNRDGIIDLLVRGDTQVLLGRGVAGIGNGTFGPPVIYPVSSTANSVSILYGQGDGTFAGPVHYNSAGAGNDWTVADLDIDGVLDILIASATPCCGSSNSLSVLFGRESGGFELPVILFSPQIPFVSHVAVADLNRDGINDVVCTLDYSEVAILIGTGSPRVGNDGFAPPLLYHSGGFHYSGLAIQDLDADGNLDLAVCNGSNWEMPSTLGISILRGRGDGSFLNAVFFPAVAQTSVSYLPRGDIVSTDFNHDGVPDFAIVNQGTSTVSVFLGLGSGNLSTAMTFNLIAGPRGLALGDYDHDGATDVVAAADNSSILFGRCTDGSRLAPVLTSVRDVPADQGGRVFVTWLRSILDVPQQRVITGYAVWRRIEPIHGKPFPELPHAMDASRSVLQGTIRLLRHHRTSTVTYWEALDVLPAHFLEGYGYTAPTTRDSMADGNPYTAFFVSALTADPFVFYDSNIDSAYSVDNLAPREPHGLASEPISEGRLRLHWNPNSEADISHYVLHKGADPGFTPSQSTRIATPVDTLFIDPLYAPRVYYKLAAIDVHGNSSTFAVHETTDDLISVLAENFSAVMSRGAVLLAWRIRAQALESVTSVSVARSGNAVGPYHDVTPAPLPAVANMRFVDHDVMAGTTYWYRLFVVTRFDDALFVGPIIFSVPEYPEPTSIFPPFVPTDGGPVQIRYTIAQASSSVILDIIDIQGRRVKSIVRAPHAAGRHWKPWGRDTDNGLRVASGVYLIRLTAAGTTVSRKLVLLQR